MRCDDCAAFIHQTDRAMDRLAFERRMVCLEASPSPAEQSAVVGYAIGSWPSFVRTPSQVFGRGIPFALLVPSLAETRQQTSLRRRHRSDFTVSSRPLVVLSLEGFATSGLGCYGSSWNKTPAIDSIASTGCVWDRWVATCDDPDATFRQLTEGLAGIPAWEEHWCRQGSVDLITDVKSAADQFEESPFDQLVSMHDQLPLHSTPAEDIVDTQAGRLVAAAIERDAASAPWSVLWLHSDFLTRCWDAPRYLALIDEVDEIDLAPSEDVELLSESGEVPEQLESLPPVFLETAPPQFELTPDRHPDLITSWMRTYGCQIRLLDVLLEILLTSLHAEDPYVVLVGTSGFQLGQNGWLGHRQGPLRSTDIRLPMIVSDVGPLHLPHLTANSTLPRVLQDLAHDDPENSNPTLLWSPQQWCRPEQDTKVITSSQRARNAISTPEWFFVEDNDASEHLFLKPDDQEDFNNVSRLRPDVVEQFQGS